MKKCRDKCPKCGATNEDGDNIDWGEINIDGSSTWQKAHCNKCDTNFVEVYEYVGTEIV